MMMTSNNRLCVRGGRQLRAWLPGILAVLASLFGIESSRAIANGQIDAPVPGVLAAGDAAHPQLNEAPIVEGEIFYEGEPGFDPFGEFSADCGQSCAPGWHASADLVYLNREGDRGSALSTAYLLDDFGFDSSLRYSIARRYDCLAGWELAFMGPFEWTQRGQVAGAGLNSLLVPAGINLSTFSNATSLQQAYTSRLYGFEMNQKWWGWDVITTTAGLRYINVEEDFSFNTTSGLGAGALAIATNNHLIGGQIGADLIFPVGRLVTTTRLRGGMYANVMDNSTVLTNAGVTQVNTADDSIDFAATLEVGYYFSYRVTRNISVRCGYEVSWLYGLALAPSQLSNPVPVLSGAELDRDGDVFYHGAVAGVEIAW